jgi:DNA-binding transcriptional MerR regulator
MSVTEKSPSAFRTISEAADELDVPAHVLRFWESKFPQISPLKRAGGRRFYRPEDLALLRGIKRLLYEDGFTIKGARKFIADQGVAAVLDLDAVVAVREPVAAGPVEPESVDETLSAPSRPPAARSREIAEILEDLEDARAKLKSVLKL